MRADTERRDAFVEAIGRGPYLGSRTPPMGGNTRFRLLGQAPPRTPRTEEWLLEAQGAYLGVGPTSATSRAYGIDGCAPARVTHNAAAA